MVERPDQVVWHRLTHCPHCGRSLAETPARDYERRQVFDLPPMQIEVLEHRAEIKDCGRCRRTGQSAFPAGLPPGAPSGARLKAILVYLMNYQRLPYERTSELLADLCGQPVAPATRYRTRPACADGLSQVEAQLAPGVRQAQVAHFDETGCSLEGHREWLPVASTAQLTHSAVHPKRGPAATDAIGILPEFAGTAVPDGWSADWRYACGHALCNAHHLRELTFLAEQEGQRWAARMKGLLQRIYRAVSARREQGATALTPAQVRAYTSQYQRMLEAGLRENPPPQPPAAPRRGRVKQSKARNLLARLTRYRAQVLAFMTDFRVPFDNNQAERDIRMMKVQQKISGCFRSRAGAQYFCRIRGYISTVRKHGLNVLSALEQVFTGNPFMPSAVG